MPTTPAEIYVRGVDPGSEKWRATASIVGLQFTKCGQATMSGTGAATSLTFAHGMTEPAGAVPTHVLLTPRTVAAVGGFVSAVDATNVTVTWAAAPANGSNNVVFDYQAGL